MASGSRSAAVRQLSGDLVSLAQAAKGSLPAVREAAEAAQLALRQAGDSDAPLRSSSLLTPYLLAMAAPGAAHGLVATCIGAVHRLVALDALKGTDVQALLMAMHRQVCCLGSLGTLLAAFRLLRFTDTAS